MVKRKEVPKPRLAPPPKPKPATPAEPVAPPAPKPMPPAPPVAFEGPVVPKRSVPAKEPPPWLGSSWKSE